ncbi:hypothetical protein MUN88_07655 [Gracilibacillus caseinilyticus]|uniref:Stage III sporulation protein AB n=1 Tax=Gracilibacillus caseinilyticus TaxID=2932256 RepID=A0ABY4EZV0_9BACI|nr:hypothetical protein [Gracilibacillus caseinilyticus]UOQ49928.1 hypothetical protein MUN88_07655 [Gracilibacillus caseinilyticus]
MLKKYSEKGVLIFCSVLLMFTVFTPIASAKSSEVTLTNEEKQLAADLEYIFETAATEENGIYTLDEDLVIEKFGEEALPAIQAFIKMTNGEELTESDLVGVPQPTGLTSPSTGDFSTQSYTSCVTDKIIDFTGIGFLTGGMYELIEQKAWKKLSVQIIKVVGKNAVRGGAVGLAASLAWFSVRCIGE